MTFSGSAPKSQGVLKPLHALQSVDVEVTRLCSSILVVSLLLPVLSGDIEDRTECKKVQIRHFLVELSGKK